MAELVEERLRAGDRRQLRLQMSWEDYQRLPEKPKAEWVGEVSVGDHGVVALDLAEIFGPRPS